MILPGKTFAILGGGQLGKMSAQAAQALGYRVRTYDAAADAPAFAVSHAHAVGAFDDAAAIERFAAGADVVTYEFENIAAAPLEALARVAPVRPSRSVLYLCQNRLREKRWLREGGFPHVPFAEITQPGDLARQAAQLGFPCVLKTADFGYDGKGQRTLAGPADLAAAAAAIARGGRWVLEAWVDFSCELSVLVARNGAGALAAYPAVENLHTRHILDVTIAPARVPPAVAAAAGALAEAIAVRIGLHGLLAVEMFLARSGEILVNELAPRPHNSGHHTLESTLTSQFEQHVRAVCDLPLGRPALKVPAAVMVNLLGDAWARGEPDWAAVLASPGASLHLYGKRDPRPGRKMGHFTLVGADPTALLADARRLQDALERRPA